MSGAIINICYGIVVEKKVLPLEDYVNLDDPYDDGTEHAQQVIDDAAANGVITELYDAYGDDRPMYFGIEVEDFYEAGVIPGDLLQELLTVTPALQDRFKKKWDNIDEELRGVIAKHFGDTPSMFVLWSNS